MLRLHDDYPFSYPKSPGYHVDRVMRDMQREQRLLQLSAIVQHRRVLDAYAHIHRKVTIDPTK